MRTESVRFYSEGQQISAILRLPDQDSPEPRPAIAQGPGWLGLKDAKLYERYHQALTDAGYLVLIFDYRGFGDSEGPRDLIDPLQQVQDWRNAITYLQTRSDVDPNRIGAFGSGGTGGGNAVYVAGVDDRVLCTVCQVGIADGEDWLHRMRREYEWVAFLERLERDRRRRVTEGSSEFVNPREEIMVVTPERRTTAVKQDVDSRVPSLVDLRSADAIIAYKPIEVVSRISPRALMIIAVDPDAVTPFDHSLRLYEHAGAPKRLVVQRDTSHYRAYDDYHEVVTPLIVEWFDRYMKYSPVTILEDTRRDDEVIHLPLPAPATPQPSMAGS